MKRDKVETMIDAMLIEINKLYNISVKKSILNWDHFQKSLYDRSWNTCSRVRIKAQLRGEILFSLFAKI